MLFPYILNTPNCCGGKGWLSEAAMPNFGAKSGHLFRDGINANRAARDYASETAQVMGIKIKLHLAQGGGAVMVF